MNPCDILGDIHGHADALEALLSELGYAETRGAWRHPGRTAVFLGDFVDRGPRQLDAIRIVRRMLDAGTAVACMGNHELNAIAWASGERAHTPSNRHQHAAFLDAVGEGSALHDECVAWFSTLPLWLDLPGFRAVHACWDPVSIAALAPLAGPGGGLTPEGLARALRKGDPAYEACEIVLKGPEAHLPPGVTFRDSYGHERAKTRVAWWDDAATTFRRAALVDEATRASIPDTPLPERSLVGDAGEKPVFFGHYWMEGAPSIHSGRRACLDFSVANKGSLVAYRFDGEARLHASKLASVPYDARLDVPAEPAFGAGP